MICSGTIYPVIFCCWGSAQSFAFLQSQFMCLDVLAMLLVLWSRILWLGSVCCYAMAGFIVKHGIGVHLHWS